MKLSTKQSKFVIVLSAMMWGTTGTAQALLPNGSDPLAVGAFRMLIGGSILFIIAFLKGSYKSIGHTRNIDMFVASLCMALYQPLFFFGVARTGVAVGTMLAIGSAPVFSGVIEVVSGKKISKRWAIATSISVSGCMLLFIGSNSIAFDLTGAMFSLGAGFSYAAFVATSQRAFSGGSRLAINGAIFLGSALLLLPLLLFAKLDWVDSMYVFLPIIHLGILATAIPYTLFAIALKKVPASTAVTLTLAEPLTASILGTVLLKEQMTVPSIIGVIMIFTGLLLDAGNDTECNEELVCKNEYCD